MEKNITKYNVEMVSTYLKTNVDGAPLSAIHRAERDVKKALGLTAEEGSVLFDGLGCGVEPGQIAMVVNEAEKLGALNAWHALRALSDARKSGNPIDDRVLKVLLDNAFLNTDAFSCLCHAAARGFDVEMLRRLALCDAGVIKELEFFRDPKDRERFMAVSKPWLSVRQVKILEEYDELAAPVLEAIACTRADAAIMEALGDASCVYGFAPFEVKALKGCTEDTPALFGELKKRRMLDRALAVMEAGYPAELADILLRKAGKMPEEQFRRFLRMGIERLSRELDIPYLVA